MNICLFFTFRGRIKVYENMIFITFRSRVKGYEKMYFFTLGVESKSMKIEKKKFLLWGKIKVYDFFFTFRDKIKVLLVILLEFDLFSVV